MGVVTIPRSYGCVWTVTWQRSTKQKVAIQILITITVRNFKQMPKHSYSSLAHVNPRQTINRRFGHFHTTLLVNSRLIPTTQQLQIISPSQLNLFQDHPKQLSFTLFATITRLSVFTLKKRVQCPPTRVVMHFTIWGTTPWQDIPLYSSFAVFGPGISRLLHVKVRITYLP